MRVQQIAEQGLQRPEASDSSQVGLKHFHPNLLQGVATCVGGYDLLSGCRMGRVELRSPPVGMVYSRDGSLLVVATQVRP